MKLDKREIIRIVFEMISAVTLFYVGVFFEKHTTAPPTKLSIIKVDTVYSPYGEGLMDSVRKYKAKASLTDYERHKEDVYYECYMLDRAKIKYGEKSVEYQNEVKQLEDVIDKYFKKFLVRRKDGGRTVRGIYFPDGFYMPLPN